MAAIDIKLNVYEGPLDLLLHLIEKNKVISMISPFLRSQSNTSPISVRWRRKTWM